jgi:hypothetical protein
MADSGLICMWVTKATRTSTGIINPGPVQVPYATAMELFYSESAHFGDKPWHDSEWTWSKSDSAFRSDDPAGPAIFASYKAWWDQDCFDRLWASDADTAADDLADRYRFAWPWLIGPALVTASPQTADRIKAFAAGTGRPSRGSPEADSIATWAASSPLSRRTVNGESG